MSGSVGSSLNAERALEILIVLGDAGRDGLSLAEIARRTGARKSAAHRSVPRCCRKVLPRRRALRALPAGPGNPNARQTAGAAGVPDSTDPARHDRIRASTGFTVYLMVQAGVDAVCAEMVTDPRAGSSAMGVGARVPMGVAAEAWPCFPCCRRTMRHRSSKRIPSAMHAPGAATRRCRCREETCKRGARSRLCGQMGYYLPARAASAYRSRDVANTKVNVAVSFNARWN